MVRTKSVLLALGGLVAVGATALLVWSLFVAGSSGSRSPDRETVPGAEANRPDVRGPRRSAPPIDVPKSKARVAEILTTLPQESDLRQRESLALELRNLLRRVGEERVDAATKEQLLSLLLTIEPRGRRLVAQALGALEGDEATARRLLQIWRNTETDAHIANVILEALAQMHVPALLPDLLDMLDAGSPHAPLIVGAIGTSGGRAGGKALVVRLTQSTPPETRQAIVSVLSKNRDPEVLRSVADALVHADAQARKSLVEILGRARAARFVRQLCVLYDSEPDEEVRLQVLRALGRIGDRDAALFLLDTVNRSGPDADHAVRALKDIRRPDAVDVLAERWDTLKPPIRSAVMGAAARLSEPSAKLVVKARLALCDPDESTRISAARVLGRPGREEHIEPLVDYLERDTGTQAQGTGLDSLLRIGTPASAEAVLANLHLVSEDAGKVYRMRAQRILARKPD